MSRWYRAYEGTITDAKLAEVRLVAGTSKSVVIATWHAILESCAVTQDGGRFETTPRRIAAALDEPVALIDSVFSALTELELISGNVVCAWARRQFESDSSTERSRKHRNPSRNANATLQQQTEALPQPPATPPETETNTEAERKKELSSAKPPIVRASMEKFEELWAARPRRDGDDPKKPAEKKFIALVKTGIDPDVMIRGAKAAADEARRNGNFGTRFVPQTVKWLNDQRFLDVALREMEIASLPEPKGYYAADGSEQLQAWDEYTRAKTGKGLPRDRNFGWRVPAEWPPDLDIGATPASQAAE